MTFTLVLLNSSSHSVLALNARVLDLVRDFSNSRKPIASVCHGQLILAATGLVEGRKCTAYPSLKPVLIAAGALWVEPETLAACVVDGNFITAAAYKGNPEFIRYIVNALGGTITGSDRRILFLCGVHYLHRPGPLLQDAGFFLLPELGQDKAYISETLFTFIFLSFVLWSFHPFILKSKKIYTVLLWCRVLAFLVASQILRIFTFYSTQLPGPNYHCREGSKLATLPRPDSVLEVLLINFPRGVVYGCGDLIFSSHMIFTLVFVRTYQKYGTLRWIKRLSWLLAVIQSFLIVASRKHYTVDVVVAWYTVNLVVFFIDNKLPEMPDRIGAASLLLPMSTKDKDSKTKEENHKLLNGNSGDATDWWQRNQVNGKTLENGNAGHPNVSMNGV